MPPLEFFLPSPAPGEVPFFLPSPRWGEGSGVSDCVGLPGFLGQGCCGNPGKPTQVARESSTYKGSGAPPPPRAYLCVERPGPGEAVTTALSTKLLGLLAGCKEHPEED